MAQGTLKSKKLTTATAKNSGRRANVPGAKKGARMIAPRRAVLVAQGRITKVCVVSLECFSLLFSRGFEGGGVV